MRKTFILLATLSALYSCNNGNYDADPNNNNNTPNSPNTCTILPADTVCSCTDSMSWYVNGVLYVEDSIVAVHNLDDGQDAGFGSLFGSHGANNMTLTIENYTGPGTYTLDDGGAEMAFDDSDSTLYGAGNPGYECEYVKLVITEDNGTIVRGKFYGVVSTEVPDEYPAWHVEYRVVKGGQFIAKWFN